MFSSKYFSFKDRPSPSGKNVPVPNFSTSPNVGKSLINRQSPDQSWREGSHGTLAPVQLHFCRTGAVGWGPQGVTLLTAGEAS